jgi:putative transposase
VAESFFATLKAGHVDHEDFATRDLGTASIGDYIESFYNCARRHSHVGYVSPIEFELRSQNQGSCGTVTLSTAAGEDQGSFSRL